MTNATIRLKPAQAQFDKVASLLNLDETRNFCASRCEYHFTIPVIWMTEVTGYSKDTVSSITMPGARQGIRFHPHETVDFHPCFIDVDDMEVFCC